MRAGTLFGLLLAMLLASVVPAAPHLSLVRPEGGACVWQCVDLESGAIRRISRFPPPCDQVEVAWSPDRSRSLLLLAGLEPVSGGPVSTPGAPLRDVPDWVLYMPPSELARYRAQQGNQDTFLPTLHHVERLRMVEAATGEARSLPPPDRARLAGVGFSRDGEGYAYTLRSSEPIRHEGRRVHLFEGEYYPSAGLDWGAPHLAHAYRLVEEDWVRAETVATNAEAQDTLGISQLDHARDLAPHTRHYLDPAMDASPDPLPSVWKQPEDARLDPLGQWMRLGGVEPPLWFWNDDCCVIRASGLLLWQVEGRMEELPGLTLRPRDHVRIQLLGDMALVTEVVTGRAAHVYDLARRRLVHADPEARAAVLCPSASCAPPERP